MFKSNLQHKQIINNAGGALVLFLIAIVVWLGVDIVNKIKESAYIGQDVAYRNTIVVSGSGEAYARPDLALTTFSVVTEAKTVGEALSENSQKMNDIITYLKEQGIAEKDLKTTAFNIYPLYEWHERTVSQPSGERVLAGYEVRQSLQVKIRDLSLVGTLIGGAAERGANQIGSLQFTIENEDELKSQAREEAIEEAKNKAKNLASQLGVSLVEIINFSETSRLPVYYESAEVVGKGGGSPEVEPGENKIEVNVTLTYEIN